jgi:hypothetical protein
MSYIIEQINHFNGEEVQKFKFMLQSNSSSYHYSYDPFLQVKKGMEGGTFKSEKNATYLLSISYSFTKKCPNLFNFNNLHDMTKIVGLFYKPNIRTQSLIKSPTLNLQLLSYLISIDCMGA